MKNAIYYSMLFVLLWISFTKADDRHEKHWDVHTTTTTTTASCLTATINHPKSKSTSHLPTTSIAITFHHEKVKNGCCKKDNSSPCCDKEDGKPQFEPQIIAAGVILIVFAVYLMVGGFMFFRITMLVTGLLVGCTFAWICLQFNEPLETYPNASNLYIATCVGIGVFVAVLFIIFYRVAMFAMCGMTGVLVSIFICCWREDFLIPNLCHRSILLFVLWLLFSLGVVFFEFVTVITSMGFVGSYILFVGVDLFVRTGFTVALETILDFNIERNRASRYHINSFQKRGIPPYYNPDWKSRSMMGGVLVICVLSIAWQFWFNKGNRFGLRIIRNSNDTLHNIK